MELLSANIWHTYRDAHYSIVDPWIAPRLERRARQEKHPVDDFLFEYYPISPKKLRNWHPGLGVELEATALDFEELGDSRYVFSDDVISISDSWLDESLNLFEKIKSFLAITNSRPARSGCFGLHEWAMVLGLEDVRHEAWPLRLSQSEIRATIDEQGLRCTHFDAFRFFTDEARPMNPLQLVRIDQIEQEQPGCLHANMDLYKYAQQIAPLIGSDVVREAFALARDIRLVDMQVAPYELLALGVEPIRVETAEGRAEFVAHQREFSVRAGTIRTRMISSIEAVTRISVD
jgi:hypothetical protein